jgi:CHRD domain-containing protein
MRRRITLAVALVLGGAVALAAFASYGAADSGKAKGKAMSSRMTSYQEVPSVSTNGTGKFQAKIKGSTIEYKLTYSGLSGSAVVAHIHFGQVGVNGGVAAFLCGGGSKPACPSGTSGTVSGTIVAADVLGPTVQGIGAGEIGELIAAMRAGVTYANVHTGNFPNGELRGQIKAGNNGD